MAVSDKMLGVTCDGQVSHPVGVEILLISWYLNRIPGLNCDLNYWDGRQDKQLMGGEGGGGQSEAVMCNASLIYHRSYWSHKESGWNRLRGTWKWLRRCYTVRLNTCHSLYQVLKSICSRMFQLIHVSSWYFAPNSYHTVSGQPQNSLFATCLFSHLNSFSLCFSCSLWLCKAKCAVYITITSKQRCSTTGEMNEWVVCQIYHARYSGYSKLWIFHLLPRLLVRLSCHPFFSPFTVNAVSKFRDR